MANGLRIQERLAYFKYSNPFLWGDFLLSSLLFRGVFSELPLVVCFAIPATFFLGMAFAYRLVNHHIDVRYFSLSNPFLVVGLAFLPFTTGVIVQWVFSS